MEEKRNALRVVQLMLIAQAGHPMGDGLHSLLIERENGKTGAEKAKKSYITNLADTNRWR